MKAVAIVNLPDGAKLEDYCNIYDMLEDWETRETE